MDNLTALVLTYNEQENIARTLSSIQWLERVLVIDSYSTDDTIEIAKGYSNVAIVQRAFEDHTDQWNFGLDQITTDWVLTLDADYEISTPLRDEILGLSPSDSISGYDAAFQYRIFGHSLRASVYPLRTVLFRRKRCQYLADGHTQRLKINGEIRKLKSPIYHDDRKPLTRWLASQDNYARLEAKHLLAASRSQLNPQDRLRLAICLSPIAMFFYLLFGRGLIFDGWPGWYYITQRVIAELLLSLRLLEAKFKV